MVTYDGVQYESALKAQFECIRKDLEKLGRAPWQLGKKAMLGSYNSTEEEKVDEMIVFEYMVLVFADGVDYDEGGKIVKEWKILMKPDVMLSSNPDSVKWEVLKNNVTELSAYKESEIQVLVRPFA